MTYPFYILYILTFCLKIASGIASLYFLVWSSKLLIRQIEAYQLLKSKNLVREYWERNKTTVQP